MIKRLKRRRSIGSASRRLHHESLEKRELLAAEFGADPGPQLISVAANSGENLNLDGNNLLKVAPRELTFRFAGGQDIDPATLGAFKFTASGGDGDFTSGNEINIVPGFIGLGESSQIVVARFASDLPDDQYLISISAVNNVGQVALLDVDGDPFCPTDTPDAEFISMDIEVGPRVVAVVPQPITGTGSSRLQHRNEIYVYFNNDPLSNPAAGVITTGDPGATSVVNPAFYKLILTGDTVESGDDSLTLPSSVEYDPALNRARLIFPVTDLSDLASSDGSGTFRLRVGSSQALPTTLPGDATDATTDVADTFSGARSLGIAFGPTSASVTVSGEIEPPVGNTIEWPGIDSPGVRNDRRDAQIVGRADTNDGVDVFYYNFDRVYGKDVIGLTLENAITPPQRQRAREVLDLYAEHLGVRFIESENRGLQIVTGDLRALVGDQDAIVSIPITGPGEPFLEYRVNDEDPSRGVLVLDAGETAWYDGYGLSPDSRPSWFEQALRGIGSLLGIGPTFEQVPGVASGSNPQLYNRFLFGETAAEFSIEPDFLSSSDIIPGQALHRPEIRDADLYSFTVTEAGKITVESFAQRLLDSNLLDTDLKLWRLDPATGQYELVARNDDFFGDDSFVGVDVVPNEGGTAATYVIGITASGNDKYNPDIADSGSGGRSQGLYDMRIEFVRGGVNTITDTNGSRLDGDADGLQGGNFNFWFRVARPVGSASAGAPRTLFVNSRDGFNAPANGSLATPFQTIDFALAQASPGDLVRLLPDGGDDGLISTKADNRTYEIGQGLEDGATFNVPRGVTVMIDAGAILKLRSAKISVGSASVDDDRSLAALQVLGAPLIVDQNGLATDGTVHFTSYDEERRDGGLFGIDTNLLPTTPAPGEWAGVEFRNDFDYSEGRPVWETEGIFIDYVSHADMRYGGGSITLTDPIVTPLQMLESRPTIINNRISLSRDAAMSLDPNSLLETNFQSPAFQRASLERFGVTFTSDYDRIGPHIRGNLILDNSINGLVINVKTPAVGQREPMTVSGRLDDKDITHVLSEVLVLGGQPGGPLLLQDRPDVLSVTVNPATGGSGSLTPSSVVNYRVTFVTADGFESLASDPTRDVTVTATGGVDLANLPAAPMQYAGRRLYRLIPGTTSYQFVTGLDRGTPTYSDDGTTRGGLLSAAALAATSGERLLPRVDARLSIDPGIVLKADSARIEAQFGADFYAEGVDGTPIVFTSRLDDQFGAGGTFDTNDDGSAGAPAPGDWSGLVFRQGSSGSIDYATIRFGGGQSSVGGSFESFNAVEILQADVRVAHSTLIQNGTGNDGTTSIRDGVGFNDEATIFIRGAQPSIVDNTIANNLGAAISVNPDALNYESVLDWGRGTGAIDTFVSDADNQGPLIEANRLDNNAINGMVIRNESLTTESVWDDTDIVHVPERFVFAWNQHHRSGLRLKSDPHQSLVVKMQDGGALVGTRARTDIVDSIGGTIQIIGQPGFAVIVTGLSDDSVGSGFTAAGVPQTDTDNVQSDAVPEWYGIVIDAGANDRNVAFIPENERSIETDSSVNAIPTTAQKVGSLAQNEKSSDENRRLGFNIRGSLSENGDIDVYEFQANGGTEVYLDIDDTDFGFDSILELIDINGNILALSNSSVSESTDPSELVNTIGAGNVLPLRKTGERIVENPNPLDAGMRVILPGSSNTVNTYYVRVRSSNLAPGDPVSQLTSSALVGAGRSHGQYQLSIRLRESDEIAGSTVRLADIRYATNAIDVVAAPSNSPLSAEHAEELAADGTDLNDGGTAFDFTTGEGSAQFENTDADPFAAINFTEDGVAKTSGVLGNQILATDPQFDLLRELDIDVYRINLAHNFQEPDVVPERNFISTIFDVDYADQLGRANTSISVFTAGGQLILHSRDSNIADDQGRPTLGNDIQNLAAGSAGTLDAYIGPVELPVGTYYVVVSSAQVVPESLNQFFQLTPADTNVRVLPVDSVRRLSEDDFDTGDRTTAADDPIDVVFSESSVTQSSYKLQDVRLFVSLNAGGDGTTLISVDPFTGQLERNIGNFGEPSGDLGITRDGQLYTYSLGAVVGTAPQDNGNTGNMLNISSVDGASTNVGDDALTFQQNNDTNDGVEADDAAQLVIQAIAFEPLRNNEGASTGNNPEIPDEERALVVGNRDNLGPGAVAELSRNILYSYVTNSGAATNFGIDDADFDRDFGTMRPLIDSDGAASNKVELGIIDVGQFSDSPADPDGNFVDSGLVTGLAQDPDSTLNYAVTNGGYVYSFRTGGPGSSRSVDVRPDVSTYNRVFNTTNHGLVPPHPSDGTSTTNGLVEFTSLSLGPRLTEGGRFAQTLFGVTAEGWIYTLVINAADRVEPAPVLMNGSYAVPIIDLFGNSIFNTGQLSGREPVGVAFSIREESPWHVTGIPAIPDVGFTIDGPNSGNELHGIFPSYDQTRIRTAGGNSLYFGFEVATPGGLVRTLESAGGDVNGVLNPGGVHGSVVSDTFSLEGYNRGDKPTLYFSYFLGTEQNGAQDGDLDADFDPVTPGKFATDTFRVFAAGDDGQWRLVGTNDSWRSFSNNLAGDEFDEFGVNGGIPVQEFFDNTGVWRQARVDLSPLAGHTNVQLRFDFATAGGMNSPLLTEGYLTEIQAVSGSELVDGSTFRLTNTLGAGGTTFQFVRAGSPPPASNTAINYDVGMSVAQVRDAIRDALARGLAVNNGAGAPVATIGNFPVSGGNRISVYYQGLAFNNSAVGFSTSLPGDEFGSYGLRTTPDGTNFFSGADNNDVIGVFVDDIVIGSAERGEVVYNAPVNRNFDVLPETRTFSFTDTQQPEYGNETLVGSYTLEIRQGAEFGPAQDFGFLALRLDETFGLGRSFDPNDRLTRGVTLISPAGRDLVDGDTFTLSNGSQRATFEFDSNFIVAPGNVRVPFISDVNNADIDEPNILARSIREAINSAQAFNILGIYAAGGDSRDVGVMTGNRIELFGDTIQVNPSAGRYMMVDLVAEETFYGREGARVIPEIDAANEIVTDVIFYDTFARATVTDYVNGATDTLVAVGKIGDRVGIDGGTVVLGNVPGQDDDIVKIYLNAGDVIDVDVDTLGFAQGTVLNSPRIQIFADTNLAAPASTSPAFSMAPGETNPGAFINNFTAATSGYYYVRVSSRNPGFDFGEYQLTIRPGSAVSRDVLMADFHFGRGDQNVVQPQGQLIIESNQISHFLETGIRASFDPAFPTSDDDAGFTSTPLDRRPGGVATLRNENTARLLPGTVIANNVVVSDGGTGISYSGEIAPPDDSPAPVPFGRIYNNTVVGVGTGIGIDVSNATSPTVLNNIVNGFATGINIAADSNTTVTGGNAYRDNVVDSNRPLATSSFVIPTATPLFQDPAAGIYIPAAGSLVIDSSFASLNDRTNFVNTVKSPVGISPSPIKAPLFDARGVPRFNDPTVNTPGGVGLETSIDRGAIDRADSIGPFAVLVRPADFIAAGGFPVFGGDVDPSESFVRLESGSVEFFEIQLFDPSGSGPDARTITSETVILTENGRRLTPGVDYTFGYADNNRAIRLTPFAGLWRPDAVYEITINNKSRLGYQVPAGSQIADQDRLVLTDFDGNQFTFEFASVDDPDVSDGAIPVNFLSTNSANSVAAALQTAIEGSAANVSVFSPGGGTLLIQGALQLQGSFGGSVLADVGIVLPAVTDVSGNPIRETRLTNETQFTIIMPGVVFDFGDAPSSYLTFFADNGARHTVDSAASPRLGTLIDTESDGQPVNQDDVPLPVVAASTGGIITTTPVADGFAVTLDSVPTGGETLTVTLGTESLVFEFVDSISNPSGTNIRINFSTGETREQIAAKLLDSVSTAVAQTSSGVVVTSDSTTSFSITSFDDEDGLSTGVISASGTDYLVFTAPGTDPGSVGPDDVIGYLNAGDPAPTTIAVNVVGSGLLHAWVDFDRNGRFENDEQVIANAQVSGDPVSGTFNLLPIRTPANAIAGDTWMRIRISEAGNVQASGAVVGGEVEDYPITVLNVPAPDLDPDVYSILEGTTLDTVADGLDSVAANDTVSPIPFLPLQYLPVDLPDNGTLTLDPVTGHFVYEPDPGFAGADTFTYRVSTQPDADNAVLGQVTINVTEIFNGPPSFDLINAIVTAPEDNNGTGQTSIQQATNISPGPETSQTVSFEIEPLSAADAAVFSDLPTINPSGVLQFTTAQDQNTGIGGPIEIRVLARDSGGAVSATMSFQIVITEVNDPPEPEPDSLATNEDTFISFNRSALLTNDTDPDLATNPAETLTVSLPSGMSSDGATVSYDSISGQFVYDPRTSLTLQAIPQGGPSRIDTFSYNLTDLAGVTRSAVVSVTVDGVNDAPTLGFDTLQLAPSGPTILNVLGNDNDVDVGPGGTIDETSVRITLQPAFGTATPQPDGTVLYTPFGQPRDDNFRYTVSDDLGLEAVPVLVSVSLSANPIARNDSAVTFLNEPIVIDVAANDEPGGLTNIEIVTPPQLGQAQPLGDGTIRFTPGNGFTGVATFQYRIADASGNFSNPATVTTQVRPSRLQNPALRHDVNYDGFVSAIDALLIINFMTRNGSNVPVLPTDTVPPLFYYDVNGNLIISASDALEVILELSKINQPGGEQVLATSTREQSSDSAFAIPSAVAADLVVSEKIVDTSMPAPVSRGLLDTIAAGRENEDEEESTAAVTDAALAELV